jgi:hypothetical protein
MLNRRDFILSSFAFLGLSNDLMNSINRFDNKEVLETQIRLQYNQRYQVIFSYEEWQIINEKLNSNESKDKFMKQGIVRFNLQDRLRIILTEPEKVLECLTEEEKKLYKVELSMLDPLEACRSINQRYQLNLSPSQFQTEGVKLLWFLDRCYSYRESQEKQKS